MPTQVINPLTTMCLLAALAGGCVIPVGPKFEGPETNYPPYVVSSDPGVGDIFTPGGQDRQITITLSDQNVQDDLFIRFLVDYPGSDTSTTHLFFQEHLPPSGTVFRAPVKILPDCKMIGVAPGVPHRLLMAVADRQYLDALAGQDVDPEAPLDSPSQDGNRIRVSWLLNCP